MSWSNPTYPNLPDFTLFVQNSMDISPLFIPTGSPFLGYAFNQALALVIRVPCSPSGIDYTLAVYNCGGAILVATAPDQTGRQGETGSFTWMRERFGLNKPSVGVVQSTSNEGTSTNLAVPDAIKQLTIGDLRFMQTPWGRAYLSFQQDFGGIWGLS
jgi:hypothetical protein